MYPEDMSCDSFEDLVQQKVDFLSPLSPQEIEVLRENTRLELTHACEYVASIDTWTEDHDRPKLTRTVLCAGADLSAFNASLRTYLASLSPEEARTVCRHMDVDYIDGPNESFFSGVYAD